MKSSILKRLFGGGFLVLGLLWLLCVPVFVWSFVVAIKLRVLIYVAIAMCCLITGILVPRLTRPRLLATSLAVALLWSLAAIPYTACFTYTRTYAKLVSEVPQDMVRVELSRTRFLLERLRSGDTKQAIEVLEAQLTSNIAQLKMVPFSERMPKTVGALEQARIYKAARPQ